MMKNRLQVIYEYFQYVHFITGPIFAIYTYLELNVYAQKAGILVIFVSFLMLAIWPILLFFFTFTSILGTLIDDTPSLPLEELYVLLIVGLVISLVVFIFVKLLTNKKKKLELLYDYLEENGKKSITELESVFDWGQDNIRQYLVELEAEGSILVDQRNEGSSIIVYYDIALPNDAESWIEYGKKLKNKAKYTKAVSAYKKALQLRPDNGLGWFLLGELLIIDLSNFDEAEVPIKHALENSPLDWENRRYAENLLALTAEWKELKEKTDKKSLKLVAELQKVQDERNK